MASSLKLQVPSKGTRPTSDRVREAIFSTLAAWDFLQDTRVLDLYAGSGALGLEALSRGAASAVLVEKHLPAARIASANSEIVLGAFARQAMPVPSCQVVTANVRTWLSAQERFPLYDVVFLDPPYDLPEPVLASNLAALLPLLQPNAAVLVERDRRSPQPVLPAGMRLVQQKNYGETTCWWAEANSDD